MRQVSKRTLATAVVAMITIALCGAFAYHFPFHSIARDPAKEDPSGKAVIEYGANGAKSFSEFFRTIKSMTIEFNTTSSNVTSCQIITFDSHLAAMDNGEVAYLVNMTGTEQTGNLTDSDNVLVWIDPSTSNIVLVTMGEQQWTGAAAQQEAGILTFITTDEWLSLLNSTTVTPVLANQTVSIGSTQLLTTTYQSLKTLPWYQNLEVSVGSLPQIGMQLVLSSNYTVPGEGPYSFRVLSLELNQ